MTDAEEKTQLVKIARLTLRAAGKCVAPYSARTSRHDFTQAQLIACLVLRAVTKSTYREICEMLTLMPALREAIGIDKAPHFTTLQKFMAKAQTPETVNAMIAQIIKELRFDTAPIDVAVDSTGLQNGVASLHYRTRRWQTGSGKSRKHVKISIGIVCGALLPVALHVDIGSSADMKQMPMLMEQIEANTQPTALLADAGYDAEWVHEVCREDWGVASWIPPVVHTKDGSIKTKWRSKMRPLPSSYGRRWHVESFFSALKRTTLSSLSSRRVNTLVAEASMKVLAYTLRR